jgi:uncharacterized protein
MAKSSAHSTPLRFEWDPEKASVNRRLHHVTFEEAQTVFDDPFARIRDDPDHSLTESRALLLGYSHQNHLLVVAYTERGDVIRLISARQATRTERRTYAEKKIRE